MTYRMTAAVTITTLFLTSCLSSVLPDPKPADIVYRLSPAGAAVTSAPNAIVMRIDRPTAPTALMGLGIVVSPDGTRLATAKQARWSQAIPSMIQDSFYDELSTRQGITGILPASGARTSYRAHLTVRNFEATFDQGESRAPLATVHYTATVADASSRDLIGTFTVEKSVRATTPSVSAIVNAQDEANKEALSAVADWIETLALKS